MIIILSIVLSISVLLYSEIKVIRNIGNSVVGLYAADSGIEKVLYYDRRVIPAMGNEKIALRGLCSMYMPDPINNPNACSSDGSLNPSVNCSPDPNFTSPQPGSDNPIHGCEYDVCDDCTIKFSTILDNKSHYDVTARVYLDADGTSSVFEVESKGVFGNAQRQIQILIVETPQ